ncbi:MAG: D-glycero-beta-D-manno-heptose 1-phosphate adenylyltransferase [Caulobacteraceae bacterium]|nr:D-glycero-beta-D-manno-heptose 1-phosphate adenylyltransferase [Caulobacteraceae bacterium]
MDLTALQNLLGDIAGARIVCVGDLMVDRFVRGDVTRISAEAPIPVMARRDELVMLGAVGNVARNISALGGRAVLISVVGADPLADEARALVAAEDRLEGHLVVQASRVTALKTRFIAAGQQLLRVDHEDVVPISAEAEAGMITAIAEQAKGAGAILLSDYGKGAVTAGVIAACLAAAKASGAPLIVDSKARGFARYGEADIVKPNAAELAHAVDMPTGTDAEVDAALARALALSQCKAVLVTRSALGMSLAVRGEPVRHFRGVPREVFDASGAGDTALSALGLGLAAKADIADAIGLALLAAGVAVQKPGTAIVTPTELIEAELSAHRAPVEAKIVTPERLSREVAHWRAQGLKVGFTNGCFDILHRGHVAYLAQARSWCDRLVVGVNSDRSVRALKGPTRPVNDVESRALVLAGLGSVDLVASFDEDTPIGLIERVRPDVLIKGADYTVEGVVGHELVQSYGGQVRLAQIVDGYSTSAAIKKLSGGA